MNLMFGDININSIRNFVEVADLGNITKAADELFISQPSLSRQLVQLETVFNVKLFYRNRNGVELTSAGTIVYNQCKALLNAYDEFSSTVLKLQGIISGNLNIAHQKSSENIVIDIHKDFLNTYPNVEISNFRQGKRNYLDLLLTGTVHLAYMAAYELSQAPSSIKSIQIATRPNMVLVSANNPLASRSSVKMADLKDHPFIMPSRTNSPLKLKSIIEACQIVGGFEPNIVSYAKNHVSYMLDIARFDGVAILPRMRNVEGAEQVKYLSIEDYPTEYHICLAWNTAHANLNPLVSAYVDFVENYLATHKDVYTDHPAHPINAET